MNALFVIDRIQRSFHPQNPFRAFNQLIDDPYQKNENNEVTIKNYQKGSRDENPYNVETIGKLPL